MKHEKKQVWIQEGYKLAAEIGLKTITIELIARVLAKNKSSFYHYFGDFQFYETQLLTYHLHRSLDFAAEIQKCKKINPDLLTLALNYKHDIFFHKQLRLNREKQRYADCYKKAFRNYEEAVALKWGEFLNIPDNNTLLSRFLHFFTENLLLQATMENFNQEWLEKYLDELLLLVKQMDGASDHGP
ncbi:MAG: hypothetical protein AAF789_05050 [Bacteroidota bacterium]